MRNLIDNSKTKRFALGKGSDEKSFGRAGGVVFGVCCLDKQLILS